MQAKEAGWVYRLPVEVEWEYACRGGPMNDKADSAFNYYFEKPTNIPRPEQANFFHDKSLRAPCEVGSYRPNRLGLYDMHGNVWEWCADEILTEAKSARRVNRGGCYFLGPQSSIASARGTEMPSRGGVNLGLRLARVPIGKEMVKI